MRASEKTRRLTGLALMTACLLYTSPDDARAKLQETLQRIINEGSGGLICIIL